MAARYRVALTGKDRFRWRWGSRLIPYGLWKLATIQKAGYVLLVEGESDTQTLWRHGLSGLGIPGANVWRKDWAKFLDGLTVYVWQEPDEGGVAFVEKIGESLPEARIMQPPSDRKDISECHVLGEDVPQIVRDAMASARPWSKIRAEALAREAQEAKQEAKELLECPNILDRFAKLCRGLGLVAEKRTAGLLYLSLTSRVLRKPVSVAVKGPSSGGKSEIVRIVLLAFPTSTYYAFTSMSERALIYDEEPLAHRFIVLYEAAGLNSRLATYIIRSLLSEGCLDYLTVEKTPEGLRPRRIHRDGPTGLILTTTRAKLQGEFETRLLSVTVRDDPKQTLGVFHSLADADNKQGPATPDLAPWRALQRWIELAGDRQVAIPFGHALADLTDPTAVRMRRDFAALLSLVKAHAILHQMQRERDAQGRIVVPIEDYRAVHDLVADLVSEGVRATVSKETRQTVEAVARLYEETGESVTVAQLREELDLGNSATTRRTAVAREGGYLQNMEDRRGRPLKLKVGDPLPDEASVFPTPELLEEKACVCVPIPPGIDRKAGSPSHRERVAAPGGCGIDSILGHSGKETRCT